MPTKRRSTDVLDQLKAVWRLASRRVPVVEGVDGGKCALSGGAVEPLVEILLVADHRDPGQYVSDPRGQRDGLSVVPGTIG